MAKYCPTCASEYLDTISVCPDDNTPLSNVPVDVSEKILIDLYTVADIIEAERIVAFLRDAGIEAVWNETQVAPVPATANTYFSVAVLLEHKKAAIALLQNAQKDGVISENGYFVNDN